MNPAPPPNFDRVARIYRWAEYLTLGPLLQRTRTHFLKQLPTLNHALILGDGDGRFLAQLLTTQPQLQALAVDTSATMLHLLRQRCHPHANRLQTLQTSALNLSPATIQYPETSVSGLISLEEQAAALARDLITTHFFLDCLSQPEVDALTLNLARTLPPGALWLLSDFGQPRILRPLAALYIRALYLAFRVLTGLRVTHLPDPQSSLRTAGFELIARHDILYGLIYAEIWQYR
jgi:hypothetical protein